MDTVQPKYVPFAVPARLQGCCSDRIPHRPSPNVQQLAILHVKSSAACCQGCDDRRSQGCLHAAYAAASGHCMVYSGPCVVVRPAEEGESFKVFSRQDQAAHKSEKAQENTAIKKAEDTAATVVKKNADAAAAAAKQKADDGLVKKKADDVAEKQPGGVTQQNKGEAKEVILLSLHPTYLNAELYNPGPPSANEAHHFTCPGGASLDVLSALSRIGDTQLTNAETDDSFKCTWTRDENMLREASLVLFPVNVKPNLIPNADQVPAFQRWMVMDAESEDNHFAVSSASSLAKQLRERRPQPALLGCNSAWRASWFGCPVMDSPLDIFMRGGRGSLDDPQSSGPPSTPALSQRKKGVIAFFSTDCDMVAGAIDRTAYIKALMKHYAVDAMGPCLHNKEPPTPPVKWTDAAARQAQSLAVYNTYKFVSAIENSVCHEYVSEKLEMALRSGAVPIVGSRENYIRGVLPSASAVIATSDFSSPAALAIYLKKMDDDDELLYKSHLAWKDKVHRLPSSAWKSHDKEGLEPAYLADMSSVMRMQVLKRTDSGGGSDNRQAAWTRHLSACRMCTAARDWESFERKHGDLGTSLLTGKPWWEDAQSRCSKLSGKV